MASRRDRRAGSKRESREIAYRDSFEFAGHNVQVFCSRLDPNDESILQNYLENDDEDMGGVMRTNIGSARRYVFYTALEKCIVDNKELKRDKNGNLEFDPDWRDPETGEHVTNEIFYSIVEKEWFLAVQKPYRKAFAAYKAEEPEPDGEEGDGEDSEDDLDPTEDPSDS